MQARPDPPVYLPLAKRYDLEVGGEVWHVIVSRQWEAGKGARCHVDLAWTDMPSRLTRKDAYVLLREAIQRRLGGRRRFVFRPDVLDGGWREERKTEEEVRDGAHKDPV